VSDNASPFAFVDGALDRADHLRADADALKGLWPRARVIVLEKDGRAHANDEGELQAPAGADLGGGPGITTFLGLHDGNAWFAANADTLDVQAPYRIERVPSSIGTSGIVFAAPAAERCDSCARAGWAFAKLAGANTIHAPTRQ
jgi:hypothetical protein